MTTCLKCHTTSDIEVTTTSACPSCGAIYSKVLKHFKAFATVQPKKAKPKKPAKQSTNILMVVLRAIGDYLNGTTRLNQRLNEFFGWMWNVLSGSNMTSGRLGYVVGMSFVLICAIGMFNAPPRTHDIPLTKAEILQKQIRSQFSSWDGSHRGVEKYIKTLLNDPNSYEHVETRYRNNGDHLRISTTISAKNGFGGRVRSSFIAKVDLKGNVFSIKNLKDLYK